MSEYIPEECFKCEIILSKKFYDRAFIREILIEQDNTGKGFLELVAEYMHELHDQEGHITVPYPQRKVS